MGESRKEGTRDILLTSHAPGVTKTVHVSKARWQLSQGIRSHTLWKNRFQWRGPDKSLNKQMSTQLQTSVSGLAVTSLYSPVFKQLREKYRNQKVWFTHPLKEIRQQKLSLQGLR